MDAVSGGLIGAALIQFIQAGFNYLDKRKSAPEITEGKVKEIQATHDTQRDSTMLNFWLDEVKKLEDKQTLELNGIRQSFELKEKQITDRYVIELNQIRQEAQAEKASNDMITSSLQSEIRRMIEMRGNDQLEYQKQFSLLKDEFHIKALESEKEKNNFMVGILDRFEGYFKGVRNDANKPNSTGIPNPTSD